MWVFVVKLPSSTDALRVSVNKQTTPAKIKIQIGCIAIHTIIRSDFHKSFVFHTEDGKDKKQHAVFFKLRESPKTRL